MRGSRAEDEDEMRDRRSEGARDRTLLVDEMSTGAVSLLKGPARRRLVASLSRARCLGNEDA